MENKVIEYRLLQKKSRGCFHIFEKKVEKKDSLSSLSRLKATVSVKIEAGGKT